MLCNFQDIKYITTTTAMCVWISSDAFLPYHLGAACLPHTMWHVGALLQMVEGCEAHGRRHSFAAICASGYIAHMSIRTYIPYLYIYCNCVLFIYIYIQRIYVFIYLHCKIRSFSQVNKWTYQ